MSRCDEMDQKLLSSFRVYEFAVSNVLLERNNSRKFFTSAIEFQGFSRNTPPVLRLSTYVAHSSFPNTSPHHEHRLRASLPVAIIAWDKRPFPDGFPRPIKGLSWIHMRLKLNF